MAKMRSKSKPKYFFNLDVFEENEDKQFKIKRAKLDELPEIIKVLKEKFN